MVSKNGLTVIEDCYNASPDSMKASLEMFRDLNVKKGRKFALLGDMLELGAIEESAHAQVGRLAAKNGVDKLAAYGPASRAMAEAARKEGLDTFWCEDAVQMLD
ncbi:UDP-N-acetylmuramoyl-tripeptide--D-alanyl-D-alanine ligase, partial [gut metagenome]